jgi:lysophospholipase L1-like esterase
MITSQIIKEYAKELGADLAGSGDQNLHLIEWDQVLNRFSRLSADLIHPSPAGHQMMGLNLAALFCLWGSDL